MSIEKVIKYYAIFLLVLSTTASVGQMPDAQNFMASTFSISFEKPKEEKIVEIETEKSMSFNVVTDAEKAFAVSGTKHAKIMQIRFFSYESDVVFDHLKLKIEGIEDNKIKNPVLMRGGQLLSEGKISDGYIEFRNFRYSLPKESVGSVDLHLDIEKEARIGDRMRMAIETKEDAGFKMGEKIYFVRDVYPISGPYFSVVNARK